MKDNIIAALWIVNVGSLIFAYRWDNKRDELGPEQMRKRAFVLGLCSYLAFAAGMAALVVSGFSRYGDPVFYLFLGLWLIAVALGFASLLAGVAAGGRCRIAAVVSGAMMIGYFVFSMSHLDS